MESNTCEIDILPIEILETIFSFLPFEDRRQARYVCKHWNEVLAMNKVTQSEVFVYFSSRQSIPNNVSRKYPFVKIEGEIEDTELFHRIGKFTRTLELSSHSLECFKLRDLMRCFPNVTKLIIHSNPEETSNCLQRSSLAQVKHMHFDYIEGWNSKSTVAFLRSVNKVTADLVRLPQTVNISSRKTERLFELSEEVTNFLRLIVKSPTFVLSNFNLVGNEPLELKHISNLCFCIVTRLVRQSPNELLKLTELRAIALKSDSDGCFFQHKGMFWPSVREIDVRAVQNPCSDCLTALGESCKNASCWKFDYLTLSMFENLGDCFENIELLSCKKADWTGIFEKAKRSTKQHFLKLETLAMKNLTKSDFLYWPLMPSLTYLEMSDLSDFWPGLALKTPALRHLSILSKTLNISLQDLNIKNWSYMRVLDIKCVPVISDKKSFLSLLATYPNLVKLALRVNILAFGDGKNNSARKMFLEQILQRTPSIRGVWINGKKLF